MKIDQSIDSLVVHYVYRVMERTKKKTLSRLFAHTKCTKITELKSGIKMHKRQNAEKFIE